MALIGIDLGTTNSLVAVWEDGHPSLLKNSLGSVLTPSVISINDDGNILAGEVAKQRLVSHPGLTVSEFKRTMGTDYIYHLGSRQYRSEELSAFLLKKMISDAEEQLGTPVTEAVISVPAYFDDNQREATKLAARIAGVEVKRLINEPSAAILYRQWKMRDIEAEPDGIYIVVDFGGGTLDISIVDCFENIIEIVAVSGDNKLGGKDFDKAVALDFCERNNLSFEALDNNTKHNLLWCAEEVKRSLSDSSTASMRVNIHGTIYEHVYTEGELLDACAKVLGKIKSIINNAVNGAKISVDEIMDVVLVGGSCKMPIVQKYISALFKRNVTADDDIDNYVGYGTGVLTGIIRRDGYIRDIVMTDVCPFSLGVGTRMNDSSPEYMSVIIPKNSILPISKSATYAGLTPFQKRLGFKIYQGEEMLANANLLLDSFGIDVIPDANGDTAVEVTFTYDINGLLEVSARDLNGPLTFEKNILSKSSQLSESEIAGKRAYMNNNMHLEKDKEENRRIMAWAQRLHAQADTEDKVRVISIIKDFSTALENNNPAQIARTRKRVSQQLLCMDLIINHHNFDDEDIIRKLQADIAKEQAEYADE